MSYFLDMDPQNIFCTLNANSIVRLGIRSLMIDFIPASITTGGSGVTALALSPEGNLIGECVLNIRICVNSPYREPYVWLIHQGELAKSRFLLALRQLCTRRAMFGHRQEHVENLANFMNHTVEELYLEYVRPESPEIKAERKAERKEKEFDLIRSLLETSITVKLSGRLEKSELSLEVELINRYNNELIAGSEDSVDLEN